MCFYTKNKKRMESEMKKFIAVLLAAMFVLSASVMAFAEKGTAEYVCQFCDAEFEDAASLAAHAAATYPVPGHTTKCTNHCDIDFDGTDDKCGFETKYVAEMTRHQDFCDYKDTASNMDKAINYFKAGVIGEGFKYLGKAIIDFVKSDTFKGILDKVVGVVKGIDLSGVIGTVKGVIGKIPFDDIVAKIQGLVG